MFQKIFDLFKKSSKPKSFHVRFRFDQHGLGDVANFIHVARFYQNHGYTVTVQIENNKKFLWEIAGVNIIQNGNLPEHPYHHSCNFNDLNFPDYQANKIAFGLQDPVLPSLRELGLTKKQAWEELCNIYISAHEHISEEAHVEAEKFLADMPRPIICLHSCGSGWSERKSIHPETAFHVITNLLDYTKGSVIVIDYDRRAPMVGDARCKGIVPSWGHIGIDRLCALFEKSDLFIGIDSGPFHVARLTSVKCLGVFREIHPNHVCLPNKKAVYLASNKYESYWSKERDRWNISTYDGDEPKAQEIVNHAIKMLNGDLSPSLAVKYNEKPQELSSSVIFQYAVNNASKEKKSVFVCLNSDPICIDLIKLVEDSKKPIELYVVHENSIYFKNSNINLIQKKLKDAAGLFSEDSIDFLFINYFSYQGVTDSIIEWTKKLKINGIMAGHDPKIPEIRAALDQRFSQQDLVNLSEFWYWKKSLEIKGQWLRPISMCDHLPSHILFVPYSDQKDLFIDAVNSLQCEGLNAFVIDDSLDGLDVNLVPQNWGIFKPHCRLTFSELQNLAQKIAINFDVKYLLFAHSDSKCQNSSVIPDLLKLIESEPDTGIYFTHYDVLCAFRVEAFYEIGIWDESFKYYSSDVDYYHRCKKTKWKVFSAQANLTSRVLHIKGGSTLLDPRWKDIIVNQNLNYVEHLVAKWGKESKYLVSQDDGFKNPYNFPVEY